MSNILIQKKLDEGTYTNDELVTWIWRGLISFEEAYEASQRKHGKNNITICSQGMSFCTDPYHSIQAPKKTLNEVQVKEPALDDVGLDLMSWLKNEMRLRLIEEENSFSKNDVPDRGLKDKAREMNEERRMVTVAVEDIIDDVVNAMSAGYVNVPVKGTKNGAHIWTYTPPGSITKPEKAGEWFVIYVVNGNMHVEGSFQTKKDARSFRADLYHCEKVRSAWVVKNAVFDRG